jgi:hypothetical protein
MNETDTLNKSINLMKIRQASELKLLKEQCHATYESLKPINLLKSTFNEVKESPELKHKLSANAIGLTLGYLTKKVFFRASHNPVKRILGTLFQVAMTNLALKNADKIVSAGTAIYKSISKIRRGGKLESDRYEDIYS